MHRLSHVCPKSRFLFCMSIIYLFAFSSLYIQLPVPKDGADFLHNPSILRFSELFGLNTYYMMELLIILGVLLSFMAFFSESFRTMTVYFALWIFYLSVFKAGQVFLWFQWDILLLEAGALTVLLAGVDMIIFRFPSYTASDGISLWLIRWLLFRLMFASGVVKLTSKCPLWWGLSALDWHFQSQCIPTPAAYYFHYLPKWLLHLAVAVTLILEIIFPFLFFLPLRGIRIFSFYSQIMLQLLIIITGNYNFFNLLTIVLCYSLLTDYEFPLTL
ncbi:unnamed protein product [Protopolystoma xenopodis]|uniref:Lipase maturation factor n=1 Tax=Protopolystoma xenopodis TaxID=117903 RepID=A0A3S5AL42_9PLAT|nr:unnamed protein product [Protopolystoma xenopodis]